MVGFVHSPPGEQESSEPKTQSVSEQGKASYPLVEQLPLDVEDYSLSFTNSFLDFDYLNDWIDPRSDPYSMEAGDFGAVNAGGDFSSNEACEQVEYSEGREKLGSLSCLGPEKSVHGILDMGVEIDCGGEVKVKEETVVSCGNGKVGELGCLIEEEMGKVNLNGVSIVKEEDGVMNRDKNSVGISEDGGEGIAMNNGNEKGVTSNELVIGEDESSADSDSGSETESSSSSSSSASSSDDDEEEEEEEEEDDEDNSNSNRRGLEVEEGEILACSADDMVAWSADDGDDDVEESGPKGPIRSKNELKDLPYVPPVNVTIQPHHQTLPVGNISSIIGAQVIVEGVEKHNPLNEGSILWITESRSPLGIVDEIFGPVKNPYYIVRYNSENDVPVGIQQGTSVSFVQEFANHVLNDKNIYKKGYDASGENDEELSEEVEFSDDEKEAEYRRTMKMKKRGTSEQKFGNKTMDKKKVRNRQKQNQAFAPQASTGSVSGNLSVPVDQSQHCVPTFAASGDQRNGGQAQGSGNGPWSDPALPQLAQFHSYGAPSSGPGMNGIPCQQPQNTGLPSFPAPTQSPGFVTPSGVLTTGVPPQQQQQQRMAFPGVLPAINNMQWPQQSHPPHPLFQMPFPNVLPLQQQMNAGPMFPSNFMPGFTTGSAGLGQGIFNQPPFGLGLHNQSNPLPMNSGQQVVPPNGPQSGSNNDSWPPPSISSTPDSSWNSNQPRHSHGGRQANRRGGGGRFRGGRGRRHNN